MYSLLTTGPGIVLHKIHQFYKCNLLQKSLEPDIAQFLALNSFDSSRIGQIVALHTNNYKLLCISDRLVDLQLFRQEP